LLARAARASRRPERSGGRGEPRSFEARGAWASSKAPPTLLDEQGEAAALQAHAGRSQPCRRASFA